MSSRRPGIQYHLRQKTRVTSTASARAPSNEDKGGNSAEASDGRSPDPPPWLRCSAFPSRDSLMPARGRYWDRHSAHAEECVKDIVPAVSGPMFHWRRNARRRRSARNASAGLSATHRGARRFLPTARQPRPTQRRHPSPRQAPPARRRLEGAGPPSASSTSSKTPRPRGGASAPPW